MKLNELRDNEGSSKSRKRVGRGIGSGTGKTARSRRQGPEGALRRRHQRLRRRPDAALPAPAEARLQQHLRGKSFNIVSLGRIQAAIDAGKLDAKATGRRSRRSIAAGVHPPRQGRRAPALGRRAQGEGDLRGRRRFQGRDREDRKGRRHGQRPAPAKEEAGRRISASRAIWLANDTRFPATNASPESVTGICRRR